MRVNGATIAENVVQGVINRRGGEHCFTDLNPARTALVVIDLQHAFMNEAVGHAVVPAVNRLAAAVRAAAGGVFWVQMTHDEACVADWSVALEMLTPAMRAKRIAALTEGSLGHRLWPGLDVHPGDEIVKKYRCSGFLPGTSDLAERLRDVGVKEDQLDRIAELSMHDRWIHTNPRKIDGPPVVRELLDAAW